MKGVGLRVMNGGFKFKGEERRVGVILEKCLRVQYFSFGN